MIQTPPHRQSTRSHSSQKSGSLCFVCVVVWLLCSHTTLLFAQEDEIICDPENPACQAPEEEEPLEPEVVGDEIICDPENPACQAPEEEPVQEVGGDEIICDPENPACQSDTSSVVKKRVASEQPKLLTSLALEEEDTFGGTALFVGKWGSSVAFDWSRDGGDEDVIEWGTGLNLALEYTSSQALKVVLQGEFRHWVGARDLDNGERGAPRYGDARAEYLARLGESYVLWQSGSWGLRFGNLNTPWGSTDLVRPGDIINPKDQRTFGWVEPSSQDGLLPQLTAELGWVGDGWSLTGLFVPFFKPDTQVFFGRDVAVLRLDLVDFGAQGCLVQEQLEGVVDRSAWESLQTVLSAPSYPDETGLNPSAGIRATATKWNTDFGLGYFWGWDRTPWVKVEQPTQVQVLLPEVTYEIRRRQTVVLDISRYIGRLGVRADLTWSPSQTFFTEQLESVRRPTFFGALGFSFEDLDDDRALGLVLEGFLLKPFGHDSAWTEALVSEDERGTQDSTILFIQDQLYGVTAGLTWELPGVKGLRLTLGGVWNISSEDWIAQSSVSYTFGESAPTISVGGQWYEGPELEDRLSLGGLYDRNDQLFFGISDTF